MNEWFVLVVFVTAIWVLIDAKKIGVRKGLVTGFANMSPWGWFFGCVFFWVVGFPLYLFMRSGLKQAAANNVSASP